MEQTNTLPKYPLQLACVKRQDINCFVEISPQCPTPQELLDGTFPGMDCLGKTKFEFSLFKASEKKSLKFCIDCKTAELLYNKTLQVINPLMQMETPKGVGGDTTSPAYTVKIRGNNFMNQTAAEILANDPSRRDALVAQMNYYSQNANNPKYGTHNQKMMQAIYEAITLFDAGKLNMEAAASSSVVLLSQVKTPNNKLLDARGLTKARTIKVTYIKGADNPFVIEIMNCMAPPANGMVGAKLEQSMDKNAWNLSMKEEEWLQMITECKYAMDMIRSSRDRFRLELMVYGQQLKLSYVHQQ